MLVNQSHATTTYKLFDPLQIKEYLWADDKSWCSPEGEVIEVIRHVARCGADVFAENRQSLEEFGRGGFESKACDIAKLFTHCFEGIVDG